MAISHTVRQVLMGLGVGVLLMIIVAIIVLFVLLYRRKYSDKKNKTLMRDPSPTFDAWPYSRDAASSVDMSRSVAFNRRSFHRNDRHNLSNAFMDANHDPTLRPLHGYNDPFSNREISSSSRDVTPRNTSSSRSGIAVVPFRESVLPNTHASFSPQGHIRTQRDSYYRGEERDGRGFQRGRLPRSPSRSPRSSPRQQRSPPRSPSRRPRSPPRSPTRLPRSPPRSPSSRPPSRPARSPQRSPPRSPSYRPRSPPRSPSWRPRSPQRLPRSPSRPPRSSPDGRESLDHIHRTASRPPDFWRHENIRDSSHLQDVYY